MSLLQEILEWTKQIPAWQSDAVSRILINRTLHEDDIDDLFALLKGDKGIIDAKHRKPNPLTQDKIPVPTLASTHVELLAMKNLNHVNAIAPNQLLPFGAKGITVIYGDNGSGKSGYSRVLKRACRSRDQGEAIHPNANLPSDEVSIPEAYFDITVNGKELTVQWTDGQAAPPELSSLAIFDSHCARAYLDDENDFSYVPYGYDVFESLVKVCKQLKTRIEKEIEQYTVDLRSFMHLNGETAVGKLIKTLSARTKTAQIEELSTLSPEELARHIELEKSLKENNPKEKADQSRLRARRIATISATSSSKFSLVDQATVAKLRDLAESYGTAQATAVLAAQQFTEGKNLLPGTGGEAWRELFDAARKFALESHPGKTFPDLGADAPCPLCQQPLAEGAARLIRFETFIQQEAEKTSQARRRALSAELMSFAAHSLSLSLDDVTYSEIETLDPQLAADVRAFEHALTARQNAIKDATETHRWDSIDAEIVNPATRLQALADKLNSEADTLEKASDENTRAELQKQFSELDARVKLNLIKESVLLAVSKLNHQAKLEQCLSAVRTNDITSKAKDLAKKVISKELEDALNREFKELGVGALSVALQSRGESGRTLHKLKLILPQKRTPRDILSEGEQRAIAIGSFLAEVGLNSGNGGIFFDDPVSSLDHRRRERVAKRLVAEASRRQVIVFTHEIYFLLLLAEEAKNANVPIVTQSLTQRADGFGVADPELPFEGKKTSERIRALKEQHQKIEKLFRTGEMVEYRHLTADAYRKLRDTWERAIEEVLLNNVILRFRKGIQTQRLVAVTVDDSDYAQINAGMTKCSNCSHDKAILSGISIPEPDELLADIMALETWRTQLVKRSKDTQEKRKE